MLTLACGGSNHRTGYEAGRAGYSITEDPYICGSEWPKRGKVRDPAAVWHVRIMSYMAGAEGEVELLGSTQGGDGDDRYQIELMAEELVAHKNWKLLELRWRAMTRMLGRRHRVLIERVAVGLLDRKTLSREELDDLVGWSVDDVKVNAPFLLMMHRDRERGE